MTGNLCCGAAANTLLILQRNRYLDENKIHIFQYIKLGIFSTNGVEKSHFRICTQATRVFLLSLRAEKVQKRPEGFPSGPFCFSLH
jgi:hypothetical protein